MEGERMNLLTLNTHSWLEAEPLKKLAEIAKVILASESEIVALQEVNQKVNSKKVSSEQLTTFCPVKAQTPIHEDNFAYLLVQHLAEKGQRYYWSWEMSHIGYDIYEEGNALLSKCPMTSEALLVSESQAPTNYRTRKLLLADIKSSKGALSVVSGHFSWWENPRTGFAYEWAQLEQYLATKQQPFVLLGDLNNPAGTAGYQLVGNSHLPLQDAFVVAEEMVGEATVEKKIDGWEKNEESLRIDYVFVPENWQVRKYEVVFDGRKTPMVSDHFGLLIQVR
jgi:maltose 6'-phosphate phosphatase